MVTTYIVGAGPVGLAATAALQHGTEHDIVLFEKRAGYTRDRKVTLSHFLLAEEVSDYAAEDMDADDIRAIFRHDDLEDLLSSKQSIPAEVRSVLLDIGSSGYWVIVRRPQRHRGGLRRDRCLGAPHRTATR